MDLLLDEDYLILWDGEEETEMPSVGVLQVVGVGKMFFRMEDFQQGETDFSNPDSEDAPYPLYVALFADVCHLMAAMQV